MTYSDEPKNTPNNPIVVSGGDSASPPERGATWLQFPRRALFLIAACAVALFLIRMLPALSTGAGAPTPLTQPALLERLPGTLW